MTLVDVTNGCCGHSWRDMFARLAAGILLRERSTGGVVHTDIVDGEGEPMLRLKTEIEDTIDGFSSKRDPSLGRRWSKKKRSCRIAFSGTGRILSVVSIGFIFVF